MNLGVPGYIRALYLNVNRCWETEVQRLGDDVAWEEVKGIARKLVCEVRAEGADIFSARSMLFFQGNENVCIGFSGQTGCVVHVIDGTEREPDIVENIVHLTGGHDGSNVLLDFICQPRCFFHARSCLRSHVEDKVSAIAFRKEVLPKKGNENEHTDAQKKEGRDEYFPARDQLLQKQVVGVAEPQKMPLEPLLKTREDVG